MKIFQNSIAFFRSIFFDDAQQNIFQIQSKIYTQQYNKQLEKNYLDEIVVACKYHEIENILKSYKYQGQQYRSKEFANIYQQIIDEYFENISVKKSILVPVPTFWIRRFYRGFDHIQHITKYISKQTHIPNKSLLFACKYTKQQSKLSRKKRLKNKQNTFQIQFGLPLPENVILIDDVISTGSTVNECAKILKQAGVKKVYGFFLATNQ